MSGSRRERTIPIVGRRCRACGSRTTRTDDGSGEHEQKGCTDGTGVGCTPVAPGFIRDAGMFHNGGVDLPQGVRTKAPQDVADGVVTAITQNPTEVFVAPLELRLASTLATVAPGFSAAIQKKLGVSDRR